MADAGADRRQAATPILFSQGQAILNRTWIPTQDSPGIRQTWEARIIAPEPLKVVMRGERLTPEGEPAGDGPARLPLPHGQSGRALSDRDRRRRHRLPRARPAHRRLDRAGDARPRPRPSCADTEQMVEAAERLYGPYRWGRYDVIVLPPSFPYGGMENPTLTFLTPTFIAGDRSLVGLVAHELAHSWSGNLVTNAVWPDSWLNEGFTSYFENRIMEALYGRERAAQEAALSWADMESALRRARPRPRRARGCTATSEARRRHQRHRLRQGRDLPADDRAHRRPRAVRRLSALLFRPPRLPADDLGAASSPTCAPIWSRGDAALERRLMLDQWVYQPGLPANAARPDPAAFAAVDAALRRLQRRAARRRAMPYAGWTTAERLRFLNGLPRELTARRGSPRSTAPSACRRAAMPRCCSPGSSSRSPTATSRRCRRPSASSPRWAGASSSCRCSRPCSAQGEWGRPIADAAYARTRPAYHSVTSASVDRLLRGES